MSDQEHILMGTSAQDRSVLESPKPNAQWLAQSLLRDAPVTLGAADIVELSRNLDRAVLEAGAALYTPRKKPKAVAIVESGCVELSQGSGKTRQVVGLLKRGDIAGDLYLLLNIEPQFTARCVTPTELWMISDARLRKLLASHPRIAMAWLCNLSARLADSRSKMLEVLGQSLRERIARVLRTEAVDGLVNVPQRTIANMLAVQRTSVNRHLKQLEAEGIIEVKYGRILIIDQQGLTQAAEGAR